MNYGNKPFEVERTFGIGVLLKLVKKNTSGLQISSHGEKFVSNVSFNELHDMVDEVLKIHNIGLKIE